jgi:16S rRNA (guanine527-N7)-methyltransferase
VTGTEGGAFPLPILAAALKAGGFRLPPGAAEALAGHAGEMLRWNRSIRLTAITDPREVAVKHVLDSLLLLRLGPYSGRILDVGSGAGYPGIPLAVCLPECRVTLVEAVAKKCAFLSRAAALLALTNVEVVHGRIERKGGVAPGPFDAVVSRATFPPEEAVPLLAPHVAPGGRLLIMTGPAPGAGGSIDAGSATEGLPLLPGWSTGRSETFMLPYNMGERTIRELLAP